MVAPGLVCINKVGDVEVDIGDGMLSLTASPRVVEVWRIFLAQVRSLLKVTQGLSPLTSRWRVVNSG